MFITDILRKSLDLVRNWEQHNPEDARCIRAGLTAYKFHTAALIQHIEQPSEMDLQDQPLDVDDEAA